jgi:hypothetical protein
MPPRLARKILQTFGDWNGVASMLLTFGFRKAEALKNGNAEIKRLKN